MANGTPSGANPNVQPMNRQVDVAWSSDHIDVLAIALAKNYVGKHNGGIARFVTSDVADAISKQVIAIAELMSGPRYIGTLRGIIDGVEPVIQLINRASVEGMNGTTTFSLKADSGSAFSTTVDTDSGNSFIVQSMNQVTEIENIGLDSGLSTSEVEVVRGSNVSVLTAHADWSDSDTCIIVTSVPQTALGLAVASALSVEGVDLNNFESVRTLSVVDGLLLNRNI